MERAAKSLSEKIPAAILIKGGHLTDSAADLLLDGGELIWFNGPRVETANTHGTGCTLSSAIACGLADGLSVRDSVENAKAYITGALKDGLNLGRGSGPLNHVYCI